jgi:hypothetical protein
MRDKKSRALVGEFFAWCKAEEDIVLDESPIAASGRLCAEPAESARAISERRAIADVEQHLREESAPGSRRQKKIGSSSASEEGAIANTVFGSLIASCELHGIEPWAYLRDLFYLLPDWPRARVLELAPAYWKQTLEQDEAQRKLANHLAFVARLRSLIRSPSLGGSTVPAGPRHDAVGRTHTTFGLYTPAECELVVSGGKTPRIPMSTLRTRVDPAVRDHAGHTSLRPPARRGARYLRDARHASRHDATPAAARRGSR